MKEKWSVGPQKVTILIVVNGAEQKIIVLMGRKAHWLFGARFDNRYRMHNTIHLLPGFYLDVGKINRYRMHMTTHLLWGILLGSGQDQPIQNAHDNSFAVGDFTKNVDMTTHMTTHMTTPHDNSFAVGD